VSITAVMRRWAHYYHYPASQFAGTAPLEALLASRGFGPDERFGVLTRPLPRGSCESVSSGKAFSGKWW
jgi:hypothetical protein